MEQILITSAAGPLDIRSADAAARDVAEQMRALPDVAEVSDPIHSPHGRAVRIAVTLVGDNDTAKTAVSTLLERTAAGQAEHPGLTVAKTGSASISVEVDESLGRDLVRVEAISLPITLMILFLVFGAVLAAALHILAERTRDDALFAHDVDPQIQTSVDMATSTVQIAVSYPENSAQARASLDRLRTDLAAVVSAWGALTLVFQGSWTEDLLGFTSTGFIGSRMPLMVFAILVGFSTDYQIFVVSRIREAVQRGLSTRQAVLDGSPGAVG